jgi:hypothetical protein
MRVGILGTKHNKRTRREHVVIFGILWLYAAWGLLWGQSAKYNVTSTTRLTFAIHTYSVWKLKQRAVNEYKNVFFFIDYPYVTICAIQLFSNIVNIAVHNSFYLTCDVDYFCSHSTPPSHVLYLGNLSSIAKELKTWGPWTCLSFGIVFASPVS